jgi:PAS domain-containing protein
MPQQAVEMILVRQLAGYLYVPVLVLDTTGTVVFYNEPAERILGVRFEETGRIDPEEVDRLVDLSEDPTARCTMHWLSLDWQASSTWCRSITIPDGTTPGSKRGSVPPWRTWIPTSR